MGFLKAKSDIFGEKFFKIIFCEKKKNFFKKGIDKLFWMSYNQYRSEQRNDLRE